MYVPIFWYVNTNRNKKSTQLLKLLDELAGACMMELTSAALITPTDV
jgi:hypothetical protein